MDEVTLLRALTEQLAAHLPDLDEQEIDLIASDLAVWMGANKVMVEEAQAVMEAAQAVMDATHQAISGGTWTHEDGRSHLTLPTDSAYCCVPFEAFTALGRGVRAAKGS